VEFPITNHSLYLSQDYQARRISPRRAIFRNPSLRATISYTPVDIQNHQAITSSGHVFPNTNYTRNWDPNKESHQNLHPKLCRIPFAIQFSTWNHMAPRSHRLAKIGSRPRGRTLGTTRRQPIGFWSRPNSTTHRLARPFTSPSANSRVSL